MVNYESVACRDSAYTSEACAGGVLVIKVPKMCFSQYCFPLFKYTRAKDRAACHCTKKEGDDQGSSSADCFICLQSSPFPVIRSIVHYPWADLGNKNRGHDAVHREKKII